jgi:hypothetical protein
MELMPRFASIKFPILTNERSRGRKRVLTSPAVFLIIERNNL